MWSVRKRIDRAYTYIYIYIHITIHIGGWGGESFVKPPTGKSFRFVRACEDVRLTTRTLSPLCVEEGEICNHHAPYSFHTHIYIYISLLHKYIHTYIYIYIYVCSCLCMYCPIATGPRERTVPSRPWERRSDIVPGSGICLGWFVTSSMELFLLFVGLFECIVEYLYTCSLTDGWHPSY